LTNKLLFAVENITPVEDVTIDKSQFSKLLVDCFSTSRSAHDTFITEETLKKTANSILLKPFVFGVDKRFDDLSTHVPEEVPGGFVPHDSKIDFKQMSDGSLMMSVEVLIWKRYSGKLIEYFQRDGGHKGVSVEIEVFESRKDLKSGLLEIVDFAYNCITGLGDLIRPAIDNAQAVLVFSQEFEEAKKEFELEFAKYQDADFSIPKKIKRSAQKALETYEEDGGVMSPAHLAMARYLAREEKITPEKLRAMSKYFNRNNLNQDDLSYGMYGAKEGARWCKEMCDYMDKADTERVSYFNQESSFEDENPNKEEENMKKKKDEAVVEEQLDMAADPEKEEEKPEPAEEPKKEEEMAAPEKDEDGEKKPEEEMAAPSEEEKPEPKSEEMAAEPEKKEDEEPEEEFSFGFSVDEAMAMMPEDDEKCSMARGEFAKGKDADGKVMMAGMFAAMQKMAAKCHAAEEEMFALKEFKAGIEAQQKQFAVEMTLKELSEKFAIPEETLAEMRSDAEKIEFEGLESWKTSVKAKSVDFAVIGKKDKEDVVRIGLVWNTAPRKAQDNLWVK
jgi:hypothetical protein